jgi:pSer/pThr/pTyr-binding forkhead associated (FHA) protein
MISCPQCGTQNLPGMAYCEHCGSPLETPETPESPAAAVEADAGAAAAIAQAQAVLDQLPADTFDTDAAPTPVPQDSTAAAADTTNTTPMDTSAPPDASPPPAVPVPASAPTKPVLTILFATGGQHEITSDITNVGRSDVAQNWHPELDLIPFGGAAPDLGVSRHQARIQRSGDTFSITDVGSTNGTFVNGKALEYNQPVDLHDGDSVAFGAFNTKVTIH